jgi:hypothetical protein
MYCKLVRVSLVVVAVAAARVEARPPTGTLDKVYQAITFREGGKNLGKLLGENHINDLAIAEYPNPDPIWIPGWSRDNPRSIALDLLVNGAINRTWQAQCFQDYAAYRQGWKQLHETFGPQLEKLRKEPDYYQRVSGLLSLMSAVTAAAEKAQLVLPRGHRAEWVGLRWEILTAIYELHRETHREFALTELARPFEGSDYGKYGRAWSDDDDAERDAFCADAEHYGTQSTPKLAGGIGDASLRWPVAPDRARAVARDFEARHAQEAKALAMPERKLAPNLLDDSKQFDPVEKELVHLEGDVDSVSRKGSAVITVLVSHRKTPFPYDCRKTGHVQWDANGVAHD